MVRSEASAYLKIKTLTLVSKMKKIYILHNVTHKISLNCGLSSKIFSSHRFIKKQLHKVLSKRNGRLPHV